MPMAYSPRPVSPNTLAGQSHGTGGAQPYMMTSNARNRSRSPPSNPQPVSKRDKRRSALQDRVHDLAETFSNERDYYFRKQVHDLQNEMALISNSQLYDTEPLSDSPEMISELVEKLSAAGHLVAETIPSGKWYANFVQEMNQMKEERDLELAVLMNRHRDQFSRIKREHDFKIQFAHQECAKLGETIRERLVMSISQKKNRLMKEKEQLDLADTNALLLHPNQFSIANPSSPGGLQSNRKTRHTRHRVDMDDMGNGIGSEATHKRKRKGPMDDDFGSPARDGGMSTPADRTKARMTQHQNAASYHISSLFTEKELAMHSNSAHVAALHFLAASKRAKQTSTPGTNGQNAADGDDLAGSGGDGGSGQEDTSAAPEMERTASQGYHATRSTRNTGTSGLTLLGELADKTATRPNLPYFILGNYHARPNGSGSAPPPPPLMPDEIEDDLARIERLASKPRGWIDTRLVNELVDATHDHEHEHGEMIDGIFLESSERFGSLHPDFPAQMDVHLVRLYPRKES
ncbi:conserved hypothetical protein [Histoplasma capsulatum G186AR]|uniref:Deacetylase complex subunit Sds3 n=2 Tax=Ajellomyces capsulatus TaxID=5037 RepID=C0NKU9_AJECG|nr:uncharacterized protein HCBG_03779 [Histoplasma capsulatum G186AR]EEH08490.1 conserved hypothetical protein [Histoplasma capsulatum G186AR]KAG5299197.1 deacetylase complex subunit Sds3 [Histoplasma capsulatum]QSS68183.1 deacetylase complex subunit Sds3 [Histoplasma capsulatum G186AR]